MTADPSTPNLGDIRPAHRLDEAALERWLSANVEGFAAPMTLRQFQGGASNPTYLVTGADGRRYVLRKKPPGTLLASAHQVDREYRVMKALGGAGFPVPVMRALCEDDAVIGTSFYVMDFLEGRIFRDARLPGLDPAERRAIYNELGDVCARLHEIDPNAIGLGDYGRPGNFFERQVGRWIKQYRGAETTPLPAMEALIEALPARIPADDTTTITHGDYRLENVMFHPTEPRIIAVLDWELSTIGNPLADFSNLLMQWVNGVLQPYKDKPEYGIPTMDEAVAYYCELTGRDGLPDLNWYFSYNIFRLAGIIQGIVGRARDGTANSAAASQMGPRVVALANASWAFAQKAGAV